MWGRGILSAAKASSFFRENRIFHQFAKFSPSKVFAVRYCLVFMIQWLTESAEKIDA